MRSTLIVVGIVAGCGHSSLPPHSDGAPSTDPAVLAARRGSPATTSTNPAVLAAVGAHPRGYARFSPADPQLHLDFAEVARDLLTLLSKSPSACGVELAQFERVEVAIGEPLRIAVELDGKIDVHAITCLVGDANMTAVTRRGIVIRDRPGGIAIEYQAERTQADLARAAATELATRCTGTNCLAILLGPPDRRLWIQVGIARTIQMQLSGPNLGHGASSTVAAIDSLRASTPALRSIVAREHEGALIIELPNDGQQDSMIAMALAARRHLLEAFKMPSTSMVPTLQMDDDIFAVKGPLIGVLTPGDVLVYEHEGKAFMKRYLAGPGQTIGVTKDGISIDGTALTTEVVHPNFHYHDRDETTNRDYDRTDVMVREHLGARSYLTLQTGPPHGTGIWKVPLGQVFFLGDNRNNSNDSRYLGTIPEGVVVGRVIGIWLALRDGVPDWERMGVPIE